MGHRFQLAARLVHAACVASAVAVCGGSGVAVAQQLPVQAQQALDQQEQRERAHREAAEREARQRIPQVTPSSTTTDSRFQRHDLPQETPCFKLTRFSVEGDTTGEFDFVQRYLQTYAGQCVGQEGVSLLVRRSQDLLLSRGFVTTRVGLPEQNLSQGGLTLLVIAGRIRAIRFTNPALPHSLWQHAFPSRPGDVLNLRALEQGLEQLKRVPSQDATMEIVPGDKPGESDVVISLKSIRRVRGSVSVDDSGSVSTSRPQLNTSFYLDNPLRRDDMLTIGVSTGLTSTHGKGTDGYTLGYTMPWGNWRYGLNAYSYSYHQTAHGTSLDYQVAGRSTTREVTTERLLSRGQRYRLGMELRVGQRRAQTFVAGSEIITQKRRGTYAELGVSLRQYFGPAQLDLRVAHKRGLPWLGGDRDNHPRADDAPTFRYRINTLDASVARPFALGRQRAYFSSQLRLQHSPDVLYGSEYIAIGGRYTVNGFDGEQTLAGRTGGYWRNSLSVPVSRLLQPYGGVDVGVISASHRLGLAGGTLAGAHLGLRGELFGALGWDGFVAWPLTRPRSWVREGATTGFRFNLQF